MRVLQIQDMNLCRSESRNVVCRRFEIEDIFIQNEDIFLSSSLDVDEPKNIKEALSCLANDKWTIALQEEMNSMH